MPRVLFVDDEKELVSSLSRFFRLHGFETDGAHDVASAVERLRKAKDPGPTYDAVVTDLRMPDGDGLMVLREVRKQLPGCPVIVLTAFGSVATSVEAMRLGAVTMLEKPFPVQQLETEVLASIASSQELSGGLSAASSAGLIGSSGAIRQVFDTLVRVAPSTTNVLITGESGTGKELVAQAVHRLSRRAMGPFVAVNCAAIPETLLEDELFGHVKGAFTGASGSRPGRFKLADKGTIFLDEIGEMPLALQGKLLRVVQERVVEPIGSTKPEPVDFRIVAATNRDLEKMAAEGKFRQDLFFRLNVVPLQLPPLRERPEDVSALAHHFLTRANQGRAGQLRFARDTLEAMERYGWPGNVRELENLVERMAVMKGDDSRGELLLADLPSPIRAARSSGPTLGAQAPSVGPAASSHPAPSAALAAALTGSLPAEGVDLYGVLAEIEDRLIREALERSGGNKNQAAKILGLNRTTLVEKLKKKAREASAHPPPAGPDHGPGNGEAE